MKKSHLHNLSKRIPHIAFLKFILALLLSSAALTAFAQNQKKYEKEVRIEESEVPANALEFVNSMKISSKIKWYKEHGLKDTSFEAKTKYRGERLSIEFSDDGTFEDLEIQKSMEVVESEAYEEIREYFESELSKYSIKKIQFQYVGDEDDVLEFFLEGELEDDVKLNYEIVISTKVDGSFTMFEFLFDDEGEFIRKSKIIQKMSDNIEY